MFEPLLVDNNDEDFTPDGLGNKIFLNFYSHFHFVLFIHEKISDITSGILEDMLECRFDTQNVKRIRRYWWNRAVFCETAGKNN